MAFERRLLEMCLSSPRAGQGSEIETWRKPVSTQKSELYRCRRSPTGWDTPKPRNEHAASQIEDTASPSGTTIYAIYESEAPVRIEPTICYTCQCSVPL